MKSILREPLVHFLLIGAALFIAFAFADNPVDKESDRIVVTQGKIEFLTANFKRTWQRQPTGSELEGLTNGYVRDEILYREALALGLDRDDPYIRMRLKQKLEFMSDDLAGVVTPSDEQLNLYMTNHPEDFRQEFQVAFRHVYLNADQQESMSIDRATKLIQHLSDEKSTTDPDTMGDSLMLPKVFDLSSESEIARLFGRPFSRELLEITPGAWTGPIRSGYGLHLVLVSEKVAGRLPELDEVREIVERDWFSTRKKEHRESIYNSLREKYTVVFEADAGEKKAFTVISEAQAAGEKRK